jgi:hypothetical protein
LCDGPFVRITLPASLLEIFCKQKAQKTWFGRGFARMGAKDYTFELPNRHLTELSNTGHYFAKRPAEQSNKQELTKKKKKPLRSGKGLGKPTES